MNSIPTSLIKRIIATVLTLTLVMSSTGDFFPGLSRAIAEGLTVNSETENQPLNEGADLPAGLSEAEADNTSASEEEKAQTETAVPDAPAKENFPADGQEAAEDAVSNEAGPEMEAAEETAQTDLTENEGYPAAAGPAVEANVLTAENIPSQEPAVRAAVAVAQKVAAVVVSVPAAVSTDKEDTEQEEIPDHQEASPVTDAVISQDPAQVQVTVTETAEDSTTEMVSAAETEEATTEEAPAGEILEEAVSDGENVPAADTEKEQEAPVEEGTASTETEAEEVPAEVTESAPEEEPVEEAEEAPAEMTESAPEEEPVKEAEEAPAEMTESAPEEEPVKEAEEAPAEVIESAPEEEPVEEAEEAPAEVTESAPEEEPVEEAEEAPAELAESASEEVTEETASDVTEFATVEAAVEADEDPVQEEAVSGDEPGNGSEQTGEQAERTAEDLKIAVVAAATPVTGSEADEENGETLESAAWVETAGEDSEGASEKEPEAEEETVSGAELGIAPTYRSDAPVVLGAETADSEKKVTTLQQMILDKMKSSLLNERITIKLNKETTYEGDVSIEKEEGKEYGENFAVDLVAEDAGDDGLQADGSARVAGNITIKGIPVRIMGITIGTGSKISITEGRLDYYGTQKADTVTVEAGKDATASIATGAGDDIVTATLTDGAKGTVATGDGEDQVTVTTGSGAQATVRTGNDNDTVTATVGDGKVEIDTGLGDDTVTSSVEAGGSAVIATDEGSDTVKVVDNSATGTVNVSTGAGKDTVELDVRTAGQGITIATGEDNDTVTVFNQGKDTAPMGSVDVDLGAGINDMSVDIAVSDAVKKVTVNGKEGNDHLHLTGTLHADTEDEKRAYGSETDMHLVGPNAHELQITAEDIESLTDDLQNKRTEKITPDQAGEVHYVAENPFTNYIINAPSSKLENIIITTKDGKALALSSVLIDTDTTWDGENKLVISDGTTVDVKGLKLVLKAKNIEVNGTLKADLVQIEALDGTGMYNRYLRDKFAANKDSIKVPGVYEAGDALVGAADLAMNLINVQDKATIVIGDKAAVYSAGDVIFLAKVEQNGGMINLLPDVNVVNVKIARASIDIAGKVYAGYDFEKEATRSDRGSVRADAEIKTTIGYNSDGKTTTGLPLAVSVVSTEAEMNVAQGAHIEAAKDISLTAKSEQKVSTRADSGLGGLPVSVAVAVLLNDVNTKVDGTLISNKGSVKAEADGTVTSSAIADKGEGQKSISGGYAAVSVVLQDVKAVLADHAVVKADGDAQVLSTANEKVENRASSGKIDVEGGESSLVTIINVIRENIWPFIKDKISSESAQEKLDKAMKKVASSNHSVKLDEDAQKYGEVKVTVDEGSSSDQAVTGKVVVTPWPGHKVKSITWRGYNPGENEYKTGEIKTANGSFVFNAQNVTVFVEYEDVDEEDDDLSDTAADLFGEKDEDEDVDLQKLIDDVNNGTDESSELDKKLRELEEETKYVDLELKGSGGAVLTYETDPDDPTKSLKKAILGEKLRLVPNPEKGKLLKQGGLKVVYSVVENDTVVIKKEVVNKDANGRYFFDVPGNLDESAGLTVTAEFIDDGNANVEADETQNQYTGTVSVAVTKNDNQSIISAGAQVTSGGKTEVKAETTTDVSTVADGSAVSKEGASGAEKKDDDSIKRPDAIDWSGFDVNTKYGLYLDATENGRVTYKAADDKKRYTYSFTATPETGYSVQSALLIYYSYGEAKTLNLSVDQNGAYTVDLDNIDMDEGSTARIRFIFANESGESTFVSSQEAQVVIPHAIQITYNALKDEKKNEVADYAGHVYYKKTVKDEDGKITSYVFDAVPDSSKGYKMDGKLKASWTDDSGAKKEAELEQKSDGLWYLDPSGIPAGSQIVVTGAFKEDFHDFKVDSDNTKNGTVTLHDKKIKQSDEPKITVKPEAGYAIDDVTVTYNQNGKSHTIKLSDSNSRIKKAKDKDGKEMDGVYTFTVPGLTADSDIQVSASFKLKSIGIYAGENDSAKDFSLSEKNVVSGEEVSVTPSSDKAKAGYKITEVTVKDASGNTVASSKDGNFTVPKDTASDAKLTVTATLGLKEVKMDASKLSNGSVEPEIPYADRGEKVMVSVTPDANFKVKTGTLKAVVKASDGSYSEEVFMARQDDTHYTFIMPADIEDPSKVSVTFTGEFEPGGSDSSKVDTSLGAGIAVSVVNSESRAEIKGTVASEGNVNVSSSITGGAKTESKAGYSKGNIGIGGAVSVQVASMDSKALVHKDADIKVDGQLAVSSEADITFETNADASGSEEAAKTGVGAGIAVAVNGSDVYAAIADGTRLAANTADKIRAIAVTTNQKVKDTVSAKAGAAGGTAAVPVAAVDVTGTAAESYMGRVGSDKLQLTESMSVSAVNNASHTIKADASAKGKGVGVGAAIGVSVIFDGANARLNQSVDAQQVTVATEAMGGVENTATASASGGKKEGKSPDQQADGLMGSAAKIAGKNKSKSINAGKIMNATKGRQKAQTGEGTVGVAGAVVVNVQSNDAISEILNGVNVKASGLVAVTALNGTTSKVTANASTTNSDVGVGVGVAVNIIWLNNLANTGDGEIEAAALKVAANTKIKEPEKAEDGENKEKVEDIDGLAKQLGEIVEEYLNKLIKEMGLPDFVSDSLIGEILNPVVANTVDELIKATGLQELLGKGDLTEKYEKAKEALTDSVNGLLSLPEKLLEPFMSALNEAVDFAKLSSDDFKQIGSALKDEFTKQLKKQIKDAGMEVLNSVKDGLIEYLKDEAFSLLTGLFSDGVSSSIGKVYDKAKELISKATEGKLKETAIAVFKQTLLNVEIPGVTAQNADRITRAFSSLKDAYQNESLNGIFSQMASYVTDTFRESVFDYEAMITKLSNTDFKKNIADGLRAAAKKAAVTLTNEALGALTNHFDLALEAEEEKATGHIIDTQAISGAGARDVGVAGSVAITVLNARTSATISDSGRSVNVFGDMTVEANELRSVHNVASAAVDANGNASANKEAANDANKDVGGGSEAKTTVKSPTVTLDIGVGATGSIRQGDMADKQPKIYITLKEGYKLPEGNKATFSYTDTTGMTKLGEVELKQDGDQWILDTASGALKSASIDFEKGIKLELLPQENLHQVPAPDASLSSVPLEDGAVTVAVKGREVENNKLSARAGELVEIRIDKEKVKGGKVNAIGYSYKDAKGIVHDVEINPSQDSGKEKAFTLVSSNEKEIIYTIQMPDADISDIMVSFVEGTDETKNDNSKTTAKDGSGKGVGVGAAFSMVYGDNEVSAQVGSRGTIHVGELTVSSTSDHKEDIASAAGSDPLAGETDLTNTKGFSLDASVALNILDNDIKAIVKKGTRIVTSGYGEGDEKKEGNLTVTAKEDAKTETNSSSFAVGGSTAVGASVAVNIASSAVRAETQDASVAGRAQVSAVSHSEDDTHAIATAMGADIARTLNKLGEKADKLEEKTNKILDGSYVDNLGKSEDNKTGDKINEKLDAKKQDGGKDAKGGNSVSSNVLRSMGVKGENSSEGQEGTQETEDQIKDKTGLDVGAVRDKMKEKSPSWQVAAAVGVTVTDHDVSTSAGAITANKDIKVTAENTGNFNTMGTGASMSLAEHANSIAAGVAVSVNSNQSDVNATGNLISNEKGDISVTSKLTQNLDGDYAGKLAAQSLSGSVAGAKSDVSIGGAITVLVSSAKSHAQVNAHARLQGGKVVIEATDKSKLAARAGGLSLSKGSSVGMGIASTTIVSNNDISAVLGDNAVVNAGSFKLNAEKIAVTQADYKNLIDMRYLVTDSSKLNEEQRKHANTGLIDLHKGEDEDSYSMDINLSSDKLLQAVDGLNYFSSQNTYAEAIAGSVMSGSIDSDNKLSLAGSFAVAVAHNTVSTLMGKNARLEIAKDNDHDGNAVVNASNGTTSRIIAGSLSAAAAKASVGATVAVLVDRDEVLAETKEGSAVNAQGDFSQTASTSGDMQVFTATMAVSATVKPDNNAVGGAVNVIVAKNVSESKTGDNVRISAGGSAAISSDTHFDLMAISGSANVSSSTGSTVAAGGTVNVIVDNSKSLTTLGRNNSVEATKDVTVTSDVSDQLISGTASASAAVSAIGGKAGAGVINVIVSKSVADTTLGEGIVLNAKEKDLRLGANNDAWMLNASLAAAGSSGLALGGAFNINVFNRQAVLNIKDGTLKAGGNLFAQTSGKDTSIMAGLSVAGGLLGSAFSGNVGVLVENNTIKTDIAKGVKATVGNNAVLESYYSDFTVDVAGNVAVSLANSAVGATSVTVVKKNTVNTNLAQSTIEASVAGDGATSLTGETVKGIYVGANAKETQFVAGAGVAVATGSAVNGIVSVLVNNNEVIADASKAVLNAEKKYSDETLTRWRDVPLFQEYYKMMHWYVRNISLEDVLKMSDPESERIFYRNENGARVYISSLDDLKENYRVITDMKGGAVSVKAVDDTTQVLLAGGLSASLSNGAGAAVVTLVSNKNVEAKAHDVLAQGNIEISADNQDQIKQLAVSAGLAGGSGVQIGAAVQVLKSKAIAHADGTLKAGDGDLKLTAKNDTGLHNIGAAVLAAIGGAAATPVGVVTYFQGQTEAKLGTGSSVEANNIQISTTSNKDVNIYAAGVAISSGVGLSGTASVLVSKDTNKASAMEGVALTARDKLDISAQSDYKLRSASAALAASGSVAVGVNAVVSVLKSSTIAELGGKNNDSGAKKANVSAQNVDVKATGKRDVISMGASAALSGAVGAGVTVMVLASGAPMSQDAADMIMYGNGEEKDEKNKTGFDAAKFMKTVESSGVESKYYRDDENPGSNLDADTLEKDIKGNGHYESQQQVGSLNSNGTGTFDATSKYRSSDLDNPDYNNDSELGRGEKLKTSKKVNAKNEEVADDDPEGTEVDISDTEDVKNAKTVNTYTYSDPTDAVIARITDQAVLNTKKVNVEAFEPVAVDLLGAALGGSTVGIGISTAVAILHSNVSASSMGEIHGAVSGVTVKASSASGKFDKDTNADARNEVVADYMSNKPKNENDKDQDEQADAEEKASLKNDLMKKVENRGIRVFGVAVGVGVVGVAVSAAVALTDNVTEAVLGGTVTGAGQVDVIAEHKYGSVTDKVTGAEQTEASSEHQYGSVLAATGSLAAGFVSAGASVSVAQANGKVKAIIERDAVVETAGDQNITVKTDSTVNVDALAVTAGGGIVAANAGVALSLNRLEQETGIESNANVKTKGNVRLEAVSDTSANSYLLGVSVGLASFSLNAAVSNVAAKINTHIGESLPTRDSDTSSAVMPDSKVSAKDITILNKVTSHAVPMALSVAGGGVAMGGNILLAFNTSEALAMVDNGNVQAETLNVIGNLGGEANSSLTAVQIGLKATGVSVNYADMRSYNTAIIRNSTVNTTNKTLVATNMKDYGGYASKAYAHTVSGNVGLVAKGMNAAIARNNSRNYATVIGDGKNLMDFNELEMQANGESSAVAQLQGIELGGLLALATTVVAINDADARTTVASTKLKDGQNTDDKEVQEKTNLKAIKGLTFHASQKGTTTAEVLTGGGSLVNAKLSVAMAYGRTKSLVNAGIHGGGEYAFIKADNVASNTTTSDISNASFSVLSASAMYGAAYSQDVYHTDIQLTGGNYTVNGDVDLKTDYDVKSIANVTPSTHGLDLSLGSLSVNAAFARNTAYAGTEFEKSIGTGKIHGNINVLTQGSVLTEAKVRTAALTASGMSAGANLATSDLSMNQAAVVRVGNDMDVDGKIDIKSIIKPSSGDKEGTAKAIASISPVAGGSGMTITLGEFKVSKAVARERMTNTAGLVGGAYGVEKRKVKVDVGDYVTETVYDYDYELVDSVNYRLVNSGYEIKNFKQSEFDLMKKIYAHYDLKGNYLEYKTQEQRDAVLHMLYLQRNAKKALPVYQKILKGVAPALNTTEMVFLNKYVDEIFAAVATYKGIQNKNEDEYIQACANAIKNASAEELTDMAYQFAFNYAGSEQLFDWEETYNYKKTNQVRTVKEEKWEERTVEVTLYKPQFNRITADSIEIYTGGNTASEARSDGAKTFGGVVAGSLIADAASSDNISAIMEGLWATTAKDIMIKAEGHTKADAVGSKPGGVSLVEAGSSDVKARVGTNSSKQSVSVVIGDEVDVTTKGTFTIEAINKGNAESALEEGTSVSMGKIKSTSIPTESWYNTLVSFGRFANVQGQNGVSVTTLDEPTAKSRVESSSIGLGMNFNTMMGKNLVHQENNIDFGARSKVKSKYGDVTVEAKQRTLAHAETLNNGGSLIEGSEAKSQNLVERAVRVNLRDSDIYAYKGTAAVRAVSGEGDQIYTRSYTDSTGLASVAKATAVADVTTRAELIIGAGATIEGFKGTDLEATATSYGTKGTKENTPGIETIGKVDALGVVAVPNGIARNNLNFYTFIEINDHEESAAWSKTWIGDPKSHTSILANNNGLTVKADSLAKGKGGFGVSNATAWNVTNLENAIWIEEAVLYSGGENSNEEEMVIKATNGDVGADRTRLIASSHAALNGIAGKVAPTSRISGTQVNQIRSKDTSTVSFNTRNTHAKHIASNPDGTIDTDVKASYDRNEIVINLLFTKVTITLTKATVLKEIEWYVFDRCDFCGTGQEVDVRPSEQSTIEQRYKAAYEAAMGNIDVIRDMARRVAADPNAVIAMNLAKGLIPLTYLNTPVGGSSVVFKARYSEEENQAAAKLFVLEVTSLLEKDVRLDQESLKLYQLWTNMETYHDVKMLPNATRLYTEDGRMVYVADIMHADLLHDGRAHKIELISALTENAFENPLFPIGSAGTMDFKSGIFTLPARTDFELYLHEVSAAWLIESIQNDFIRTLMADQNEINECAKGNQGLPQGTIIHGAVDGGIVEGCHLYWIGDTPETAKDPDQTLIVLMVNEETDEVDAFRTSVSMLEQNEPLVDVSLYLYRDSKSDRMEIECYNAFWFDTEDNEMSLVKLVTGVLENRELEMPRPLRIKLRAFTLAGADMPVYSICDRLFILSDISDGHVDLLDGAYTARFDGDVFESGYIRVEGISSNNPTATLKEGQVVWPEKTGEDTAEDVGGRQFVLKEGTWVEQKPDQLMDDQAGNGAA